MKKDMVGKITDIRALMDGNIYGISTKHLSGLGIAVRISFADTFCEEIKDFDDNFYASEILVNRGYEYSCSMKDKELDYTFDYEKLNLEEGIIMCRYNKKDNSFTEIKSNVKMPFHILDLINDDNSHYDNLLMSSDSTLKFEEYYKKTLNNPIVVTAINNRDFSIYNNSLTLRKSAINDVVAPVLIQKENDTREKLKNQFQRVINIDSILAKYEDNVRKNSKAYILKKHE